MLQSVSFSSASADPSGGGTDVNRVFSWQVSAGATALDSAVSTLNLTTADGAPVAAADGSRQIVFIDGNVPDINILANGVARTDQVVLLDPNSDGVKQIANYLAANDEHNLDAIQIVSHGEDGALRLGDVILSNVNIENYESQLSEIGAALKPGGDILLYGCDVAQDVVGDLFVDRLAYMTGANVAASTNDTGAAALGGDWTLEYQTGPIDASVPFSQTALNAYPDILTNEVWFVTYNSGTAGIDVSARDFATNDSATSVAASAGNVFVSDAESLTPPLRVPTDIAVDPAMGKIYVLDSLPGTDGDNIYSFDLSGTASQVAGSQKTIYSDTLDASGGIALDSANHYLYFTQISFSNANDGLYRIDLQSSSESDVHSSTPGTPAIKQFYQDALGASTAAPLTGPLALDVKNGVFYLGAFGNFGTAHDDGVFRGTLPAPGANSVTESFTEIVTFNGNLEDGLVAGVAVVPGATASADLVYYLTSDAPTASPPDTTAAHNAVYVYNGTSSTTIATSYSGAPNNIVVDPTDSLYYFTVGEYDLGGALTNVQQIYVGTIGSAATPTVLYTPILDTQDSTAPRDKR